MMHDRQDAHPADPQSLRASLHSDLGAALKARQPEAVTALRTTIAAIDNAEAVDPKTDTPRHGSGPVAGALTGVASTEVPRRRLSMAEQRAILRNQLNELIIEADRYHSLGQTAAAQRLRREADVLREYL